MRGREGKRREEKEGGREGNRTSSQHWLGIEFCKGDPGSILLSWEGPLSSRGHLTNSLCLASHLSLDIQGRVTGWKGMTAWPIESKEEAVGTGPESILGWDFFVSSVLWKPAAILFLSTIPADLLKGRICISMGNLHFHSRQRLNFLSLVVLRQVNSGGVGGVSV